MRNGDGWFQDIDGAMKHVTVGKAGVWGVDAGRNISYREGVTSSNIKGSSWTRISGTLIQIDSGPSGIVYGVNSFHNIFCRKGITLSRPKGTEWVQVPGSLKYVSCGVHGCWGVNSTDQIFFRYGVTPNNCAGTTWIIIDGALTQLEVDKEGKVYGVDVHKTLYVRDGVSFSSPTGTKWRKIPSHPFTHISAGYSKIFALMSTGAIYAYDGVWAVIPGSLKQLDHGLTTAVWGVDRYDTVYRLKNDKSGLQKIPGAQLKHVSAGEAGIWGVDKSNSIYYRIGVTEKNPSGTSWKLVSGRLLKHIDSGPSGIVYGVNDLDQIYCRTGIEYGKPFGDGWMRVSGLPGSLKYISCGVLGCWGLNNAGKTFYRSGVTKENCAGVGHWHDIPGLLKQIEVGAAGDVYAIDSAGNVYRRTGISELLPMGNLYGWLKIKKDGSHITTGLNGQYLLSNGFIYYSGGCPRRSP